MKTHCQIYTLQDISEPINFYEKAWQFRNRLKRIFKRRWWYLQNMLSERTDAAKSMARSEHASIRAGDMVRVKSKEEIQNTLDRWNRLRGCAFMEEMWPYCGTTHSVFKHIERFLDERDYLMKKCKGIFILEGVVCEGTNDFGPCDRSCFFFWREEWLEKLETGTCS